MLYANYISIFEKVLKVKTLDIPQIRSSAPAMQSWLCYSQGTIAWWCPTYREGGEARDRCPIVLSSQCERTELFSNAGAKEKESCALLQGRENSTPKLIQSIMSAFQK